MGATFYTTFYWQHKNTTKLFGELSSSNVKVNYLKTQQSGLNGQITKLINENNSLNNEVSSAGSNQSSTSNSSISTATQTTASASTITNTPTISIIGAKRYTNPSNTIEVYIEVDVKVENDGTAVLTVPINGFKIFDSAQDEGADFGDLAGTTLPDGYTVLTDMTLNPGQSVSGVLLLSTIYPNYSLFTLQYGTQDYSINVN